MTGHDAVLAVGLHRFAARCRQRRQVVTASAANKIAAMARIVGVAADRSPTALGFDADWTLPEEPMWTSMHLVEESNNLDLLRQLDTLLADLTVDDVEGYEEDPEPNPRAVCG